MKLKILFLALFAAGVVASIAIAKPPPGKGNPHQGGSDDAAVAAPAAGTTAAGTSASTSTAAPSPGKGHGKGKHVGGAAATATTASTTTASTTQSRKVLICHKTGNGKYVLVSVSVNSALARGKHGGDVPAAGGKCPTSSPTGTGTTGTTTT